ncbi:hypothetical protein N0V93_005908 [Gnomoniopsis smithogilvyi]|uniref:C2H2-type domain-containing protein n=1 Tax=Gnomoniopsis smithogilvyi TaxID=1191159 RepID=A0A9W9CXK5_9PEZI|nr:hypothetical protein N0V93_005908 [Gnomoniopsis smithogilvyi]
MAANLNQPVEASTITVNTKTPSATFPPPKTDKPRPHVCMTCQRAFARLEHLKRHERSHTKEKPFECADCKRCFARRDLLLRHQQKLHQSTAPSTRPRNRRESASGVNLGAQSRARKNSVATANPAAAAAASTNPASMRPRANTISTIDPVQMQQYMAAAASGPAASRMPPTHSRHPSLMGLQGFNQNTFDNPYSGMASALGHRHMPSAPLRVETRGLPFESGPITAPVHNPWWNDYSGSLFSGTINPNMLHDAHSPQLDPISPPFNGIPDLNPTSPFDNFGMENLMIGGVGNSPSFPNGFFGNNTTDSAIVDGSSSSAISTASPGGMSDAMIDGSNNPASTAPMTTSIWAPGLMSPQTSVFGVEYSANHGFPDLMSGSPHPMQSHMGNDAFFTPPPSQHSSSLQEMSFLTPQSSHMDQFAASGPKTPSSINGIHNHGTSPVATITDSTRTAILGALSSTAALNSTVASRKPSFSLKTAPFSPHAPNSNAVTDNANNLPSTQNLQRFVAAYITYFHPHLPFLHLPTLSFETPARAANGNASHVGGPACLVLSMAAIGALYETEHDQAQKLFELAKKMIQTYLDQRRRATVRKAYAPEQDLPESQDGSSDTPLWLVQSMLLNVVYGHNCADKLAGEIASTHCAALVSLAQGADLYSPPKDEDVETDEQGAWLRWKSAEERKRTLYAIFILSSLLVSAYNHPPTLTTPEIILNLPCDEEFFEAESSAVFHARGGVADADRDVVSLQDAFVDLMRTHDNQIRQRRMSMQNGQRFGSTLNPNELPPSKLRPSAFGCLILIHSIHNYIWETRQRHHNKVWTPEETEKMHRVIEPALNAWHAAWGRTPHHSAKRPNPFNKGPLSADAIHMLQLAHVRLFVNLGRTKERFWQRDWQALADELCRGSEVTQHAEPSPQPIMDERMDMSGTGLGITEHDAMQFSSGPSQTAMSIEMTTNRERLLRKAAYFAADTLSTPDKMDLTFADLTSRELPLQAAMCTFDCAQVLAEWIATLQDRVGQYIGGILGQDEIDIHQVPAVMFLDEDDTRLLQQVREIMEGWEKRLPMQFLSGIQGGYAVKILKVIAYTFEKADVWPGSSGSVMQTL